MSAQEHSVFSTTSSSYMIALLASPHTDSWRIYDPIADPDGPIDCPIFRLRTSFQTGHSTLPAYDKTMPPIDLGSYKARNI